MSGARRHPEEIRSIVLATGVADLLLPNVAVAEIIGYTDPAPYASAPPWLLGSVSWRGFPVPLVSLAMANEQPIEVVQSRRPRIVICYTPSGNKALPYVGIVAAESPRLARLSPEVLEPTQVPAENPFVLHSLIYAETLAWIPDMDAIERAVIEAKQT
jgi:chemosensory pili system protein ChpC